MQARARHAVGRDRVARRRPRPPRPRGSSGSPKTYACYEELLADPEVDARLHPAAQPPARSLGEPRRPGGKARADARSRSALTRRGAPAARRARSAPACVICEAAMVRVHPRWLARARAGAQGPEDWRAGRRSSACSVTPSPPAKTSASSASMGGGVLLDTGFYPVTMSRFCFDDEPTTVAARMEQDPDSGVDVMAGAVLRFPRGHAIFTCDMRLAPQQRAQILGSKGASICRTPGTPPPIARRSWCWRRATAWRSRPPSGRASGRQPVHDPGPAVRARGGHGRPGPIPLEDSIQNMAVLDALRRSAGQRTLGSSAPRLGAAGDGTPRPPQQAWNPVGRKRSERPPLMIDHFSPLPLGLASRVRARGGRADRGQARASRDRRFI